MDSEQHVAQNLDTERQLPPNGPSRHSDNSPPAFDLEDSVQSGFYQLDQDASSFGGLNSALSGLDDGAPYDSFRPGDEWSYPDFEQAMPSLGRSGLSLARYGYEHNPAPHTTVNDSSNLDPWGIFESPEISGGKQTAGDATFDLDDPHPGATLPQYLSSGPLENYTVPADLASPHIHQSASRNALFTGVGPIRDPTSMDFGAQVTQRLASPQTNNCKRPRKRRRLTVDSTSTPEPSKQKKQCAGCDKGFCTSKDPDQLRCTRCWEKHVKHTAGHTTYVFDPTGTIGTAWTILYPQIEPLALLDDDVDVAAASEHDYVRRLMEAVSLPYVSDGSGTKEDQQRIAQQGKLNKKPFDSVQYRNDLVNARIRFLFHIARAFHAGGPSLYDTGGDNAGYGIDPALKFSTRMERIIQLLTRDKDIAMDVIEGRGVTALVHNPNKYERRKRDNKKSNDTKQDLQEKGKQMHMLEAGPPGSPNLQDLTIDPMLREHTGVQFLEDPMYPFSENAIASLEDSFLREHDGELVVEDQAGGSRTAEVDELEGYAPAPFM